jgi:aspartate/methionine/tyrosine aminotransferase
LIDNGLELVRKKNYVRQYFENELDYPSTSICTGPSTSYLLFEAPIVYLENTEKSKSEISEEFSDDLYFATGVMLSGNLFSHSNLSSYVRLHLGSDPANIEEIMKRFKKAGLNYHMKYKFNSLLSKIHNLTDKLWNIVSN